MLLLLLLTSYTMCTHMDGMVSSKKTGYDQL